MNLNNHTVVVYHEKLNINNIIFILGINCWNPSFDITPAYLITGIITEKGVFLPHMLKSLFPV